jgi:molecular chaperone GrpE
MMSRKKHKHDKKNKQDKEDKITLAGKEYEELLKQKEIAEERLDILARLQAEVENTKKRLQKEKEEFVKFANDELISKLLPVLDNFKRAIENGSNTDKKDNITEGIKLIYRQFEEVLKEFGLTPIKAVGEKFNPHYHEAVTHEQTEKFEDGVIIEEFQKGYLLNGRLLRPSVVKVAKSKHEK